MVKLKMIEFKYFSLIVFAMHLSKGLGESICKMNVANVTMVDPVSNITAERDYSVSYSADFVHLAGCENDRAELHCEAGKRFFNGNFSSQQSINITCVKENWQYLGENITELYGCKAEDICQNKVTAFQGAEVTASGGVTSVDDGYTRLGGENEWIKFECKQAGYILVFFSYQNFENKYILNTRYPGKSATLTCKKTNNPSYPYLFKEPIIFPEGANPDGDMVISCSPMPPPTKYEYCLLRNKEDNSTSLDYNYKINNETTASFYVPKDQDGYYYASPDGFLAVDCVDSSYIFYAVFITINGTEHAIEFNENKLKYSCIYDRGNQDFPYYFKLEVENEYFFITPDDLHYQECRPFNPTIKDYCILKFDYPTENHKYFINNTSTAKTQYLDNQDDRFYGEVNETLILKCNDTKDTFHLSYTSIDDENYDAVDLGVNELNFTCNYDKDNSQYNFYFVGNNTKLRIIKPDTSYEQMCQTPKTTTAASTTESSTPSTTVSSSASTSMSTSDTSTAMSTSTETTSESTTSTVQDTTSTTTEYNMTTSESTVSSTTTTEITSESTNSSTEPTNTSTTTPPSTTTTEITSTTSTTSCNDCTTDSTETNINTTTTDSSSPTTTENGTTTTEWTTTETSITTSTTGTTNGTDSTTSPETTAGTTTTPSTTPTTTPTTTPATTPATTTTTTTKKPTTTKDKRKSDQAQDFCWCLKRAYKLLSLNTFYLSETAH